MTNAPTKPPASPAAMLAAVLRVVGAQYKFDYPPGVEWEEFLDPTSKDDLARVVAMLTPEQLGRFDAVLGCRCVRRPGTDGEDDEGAWTGIPTASAVLLLTPSQILAALVAATGAEA